MSVPRASFCRRAFAVLRGIKRRMYVAHMRRGMGRLFPWCSWKERELTACAIWRFPSTAPAHFALLRIEAHLAGAS